MPSETSSKPQRFKLVVSIINFRTEEMTKNCIQSVLADIGDLDAHVTVVDNLSGDGSAEAIEAWITEEGVGDRVTLVKSPTNSGFSGGHNQGIASYPADFYLLLNSDALVREGFLETILAASEANPKSGFIAPKIEYSDGEVQISAFRFASPMSEIIRGANTGSITKLLKRWEVPIGTEPREDQIDWASFACIIVRGEMVEQIGPMDEGYFLYFEDAEYCLRGRRAGWGLTYAPEARAIHFRGGSGPVKKMLHERKRVPAYYYASRTRFFYQAYGFPGLMAANVMWITGRIIAHLRPILGGRVTKANEAEGSDLWINAFNPLGPRRAPGE